MLLFASVFCVPVVRAQIELDKALRIGDLWVFPTLQDAKSWSYLPAAARLVTTENGDPKFSFLIYVKPDEDGEITPKTITQADGGALVHFLVEYYTPPELIEEAQTALRRRFDDDEIELTRPIIFETARYNVISSILTDEGEKKASLVAAGRAPLFEGAQMPLSYRLTPDDAQILLASLQTDTPDVSVVFDMGFSGLNAAYDADLYIDWTETFSSMEASGGVNVYFVQADIEAAFDNLFRNNSIRLEVRGDDPDMEGLLTSVYDKLLELMFRPVETSEVEEAQRGGIGEAIASALGGQNGGGFNFGIRGGYKMKELRTEGQSRLNFNKRATVQRNTLLTVNIGNLYSRYGDNPNYFRIVNMSDPTWDQREVRITVDGTLVKEFDKFVNNASVVVKKQHGDGSVTQKEIVIDRGTPLDETQMPRFVYLNQNDDADSWLSYDYQVTWNFFGGGQYITDWINTASPLINLYTPYRRQPVELVGDVTSLVDSGVRAVFVRLGYDFFGERKTERLSFRPDNQEEDLPIVDLTLPNSAEGYDYEITWVFGQTDRRVSRGEDQTGFLFIDETPPE